MFKTYEVKATPKFAAWDERNGWTITVRARTKAEAIKDARREIRDAGHMGQITFRATEV